MQFGDVVPQELSRHDQDVPSLPPAFEPENLPQVKTKTFGCKKDVFLGKARKTRGGLTRDDLVQNKRGKVVSRKKSEIARERGFLAGNNKNGVNYYIAAAAASAPPEEPM